MMYKMSPLSIFYNKGVFSFVSVPPLCLSLCTQTVVSLVSTRWHSCNVAARTLPSIGMPDVCQYYRRVNRTSYVSTQYLFIPLSASYYMCVCVCVFQSVCVCLGIVIFLVNSLHNISFNVEIE